MHHTERRRATVNIGTALRSRGWRLHGFTEDRSDIMTDLHLPASWDGVATHPDHDGVVAVVDGTNYTAEEYDDLDVQATPGRKTWHVQRDGTIITSGIGLGPCAGFDDEAMRNANTIADRIEAALDDDEDTAPAGNTIATSDSDGDGRPGYQVVRDRDWTWIYFDDKPATPLREALKETFNARWSRTREGWYIRRPVEPEAIAEILGY